MISSAASVSLPALLGVSASAGCLLSLDQVRHLAMLAVQRRPADLHARIIFGGPLGDLEEGTLWGDPWQNAPFLIIAGEQGALALVSRAEGERFRCVMLSDPERVDHAVMALSQFGDETLSLPELAAPEPQRAFVGTLVAALVADPRLNAIDLPALMPAERRWIELARVSGRCPDLPALFATPDLRQALHEQGVDRALIGTLSADRRQMRVLAAIGGKGPATIGLQGRLVDTVLRSRRPGSTASAAESGLDAEGQRWLGTSTLTAIPLQRDGTLWGLLLAASQRPLANAARAALHGLGALISATHGIAAPTVGEAASPASAARSPRPGAAAPAPRTGEVGPMRARRQAALAGDIGALFERLTDAVVLVDGQGRLVSYTSAAAAALGLGQAARGHSLVESGASCLTPLLSEALMADGPVEGTVQLPRGGQANVTVRGIDDALWSFLIFPAGEPKSAPPAPQPKQPAALSEREQQETFLSNFSRVIQVPLRELRTLITSVPAAGELNEQQSRLIGQVVRLNSELTMLVNDLLSLGQIRLQAQEVGAPLRLDLLIEAAVGLQYAEFGRRGQHVTVDLAPGLPRVIGSEEGLGRAINALIDNAIKYSPGGAHIRVAARHEAGNVLVMVEDSGYGLSEEEAAQVFEPFYRAESAERAGVSGRGLGLTIAKAVIEQHGGQIWVDSRPEGGSTFTFRLPCADTDAAGGA
ncbi:MAG: HAMP domain-containing sensor histidine kinase [Oscillochloridaceae bacterium]|nr:HAMP domain-containing histidine kinase [Chloroflexaceae bacterium]MDW8388703.1 HAMP domain-containing sensor histidine kinase [Oscillochloridaceae bacterium]